MFAYTIRSGVKEPLIASRINQRSLDVYWQGKSVIRLKNSGKSFMLRYPASGRVLEKNGFKQEGLLRQRVRKWGKFEDVALMAILRQDWQA